MKKTSEAEDVTIGMGLVSLILGSVGLLLFALPVLNIPLGVAGIVFGLLGLILSLVNRGVNFRWPIAGTALSLLALAIGWAIAKAPAGWI